MHVIVRYVQEALKFKLHFNSSLNAEATCEKCLHMCGMAGDAVRLLLLLVLVLMMVFLLLLVIVLQLMLLLLLKLHCHSHTHTHMWHRVESVELAFEHCSYRMHFFRSFLAR